MTKSIRDLARAKIARLLAAIDEDRGFRPSDDLNTYEAFEAAKVHWMDQIAALVPDLGTPELTEEFVRVTTRPSNDYVSDRMVRSARAMSLLPALARLRVYMAADPAEELPTNSMVRVRGGWDVCFDSERRLLTDSQGMVHIARLIAKGIVGISVRDLDSALVAEVNQDVEGGPRDAENVELDDARVEQHLGDEIADKKARNEYRARLETLVAERAEASESGDQSRLQSIDQETDQIEAMLRSSVSFRSKPRVLGGAGDAARSRVKKAIASALRKIEAEHPKLHAHLAEHLEKPSGAHPAYRPSAGTNWIVSADPPL